MEDENLAALRADWRRQNTTFTEVYARLRRTRWRPHAVLALELAGASIALAVGVWYATVAVERESLFFALSAAVMFLAMPAFAVATVLARKGSLHWEEETPAGVLAVAMRRVDASLRAIRIGRWQMAILVSFVAVLWVTQAIGLIDVFGFLVFYTVVVAATATPYVVWLGRRQKRLVDERATCRELLEDLAAAGGQADIG